MLIIHKVCKKDIGDFGDWVTTGGMLFGPITAAIGAICGVAYLMFTIPYRLLFGEDE